MKNVIWLLIMIPCSVLLTGIGIFAWKREKPIWFWAGTEVEEREITDVRAYNRENGWMWIAFSGLYWVSTIAGVINMKVGGIILVAGTAVAIPLLVYTYSRILKKYQVQR